MSPPPGIYTKLWRKIKEHRVVKIRAPEHLHRRIKKAIANACWRDSAFKDDMFLQGRRAYIRKVSDGTTLTFTLVLGMGFEDFGVTLEETLKAPLILNDIIDWSELK